jgi:hypothetical protein
MVEKCGGKLSKCQNVKLSKCQIVKFSTLILNINSQCQIVELNFHNQISQFPPNLTKDFLVLK